MNQSFQKVWDIKEKIGSVTVKIIPASYRTSLDHYEVFRKHDGEVIILSKLGKISADSMLMIIETIKTDKHILDYKVSGNVVEALRKQAWYDAL